MKNKINFNYKKIFPFLIVFSGIILLFSCSGNPSPTPTPNFKIVNKNYTFDKQDWPEENIDETSNSIISDLQTLSSGFDGSALGDPYINWNGPSYESYSSDASWFLVDHKNYEQYFFFWFTSDVFNHISWEGNVGTIVCPMHVDCVSGDTIAITTTIRFEKRFNTFNEWNDNYLLSCNIATEPAVDYIFIRNEGRIIWSTQAEKDKPCLLSPIFYNYGAPQSTHDSGKKFEGEEGYSNINMETTIEFKKNIRSISHPDWGTIDANHLLFTHITNNDNVPEVLSITFVDNSIMSLSIIQNYGEVTQSVTPTPGYVFWYDNTTHDSISEITDFQFNSEITENY